MRERITLFKLQPAGLNAALHQRVTKPGGEKPKQRSCRDAQIWRAFPDREPTQKAQTHLADQLRASIQGNRKDTNRYPDIPGDFPYSASRKGKDQPEKQDG